MPYIEKHLRKALEHTHIIPEEAGQLNYKITKIVHTYLQRRGLCYENINSVIGVLECAKLELYRMIAAPYENKKKRENSAISSLDDKTLEDVR